MIARDVEELHGNNNLTKQTALTEKGETVNGRGDTPNMHDILTGSQPDGTAFTRREDRTCGNWTKSGARARRWSATTTAWACATTPPAKSWNSSHPSRGGCSQEALRGTGGAGLRVLFRGVLDECLPSGRRVRLGVVRSARMGSFTPSLCHAMTFFELYETI